MRGLTVHCAAEASLRVRIVQRHHRDGLHDFPVLNDTEGTCDAKLQKTRPITMANKYGNSVQLHNIHVCVRARTCACACAYTCVCVCACVRA